MHITDQRKALVSSLERSGYYPAFVTSVVDVALAGDAVQAHYVHMETTFLGDEVRRHVTVLVLTEARLVIAHVDDHAGPNILGETETRASATTESVTLKSIRSVVMSHTVANPEKFVAGMTPMEVSLAIGWGAVSRVDLEPAGCPDPNCEADHGLTGQITADDVMLRVSAEAEGTEAVNEIVSFGRVLSAVTGK